MRVDQTTSAKVLAWLAGKPNGIDTILRASSELQIGISDIEAIMAPSCPDAFARTTTDKLVELSGWGNGSDRCLRKIGLSPAGRMHFEALPGSMFDRVAAELQVTANRLGMECITTANVGPDEWVLHATRRDTNEATFVLLEYNRYEFEKDYTELPEAMRSTLGGQTHGMPVERYVSWFVEKHLVAAPTLLKERYIAVRNELNADQRAAWDAALKPWGFIASP